MLNLRIICVGKIKEKALKELVNEYTKRLTKYVKLEITELEDEKLSPSTSEEQIKLIESKKIEEKLKKYGKSTVIFLDLKGQEYTSENFAQKLNDIQTYSSSSITFVIGGSLGMTDELLAMGDEKICFSKMTFPHQLIRLFLLEQVFRAFKILNNEIYHH